MSTKAIRFFALAAVSVMIKNIVFDIGNVLVDFRWREYIKSFGVTDEEFDRIVAATVYSSAWSEFDRGILSEEEVLESFYAADPDMKELIYKIFSKINGLLTQFDYAKDWIRDLQKRGFKVYCLSNMSYKAVDECAEALDFIPLLDGSILSCDVKLCKPEREIYELLFKKYDLVPGECLFIDDLEKNINAAIACGMKGHVFKDKADADAAIDEIVAAEV